MASDTEKDDARDVGPSRGGYFCFDVEIQSVSRSQTTNRDREESKKINGKVAFRAAAVARTFAMGIGRF